MRIENIINLLLLPLVAFPWLFLTVAFAANNWIGYGVTYFLALVVIGFFAHSHYSILNLINNPSPDEEPLVTQGMQPAKKQITMEVIRTIALNKIQMVSLQKNLEVGCAKQYFLFHGAAILSLPAVIIRLVEQVLLKMFERSVNGY